MKLSNTMIMNEALLPSSKRAFTLAEVLITLSILGVVAALTIPSLVNRQNELAAITKLKKAISTYESAGQTYMAETEETDLSGMVGTAGNCDNLSTYFKMTKSYWGSAGGDDTCNFTTADGAFWIVGENGNAVVLDSTTSPRYGVVMWAKGGVVNGEQTEGINGSQLPDASDIPYAPTFTGQEWEYGDVAPAVKGPNHGYYKTADILNITKSKNDGDDFGGVSPSDVLN